MLIAGVLFALLCHLGTTVAHAEPSHPQSLAAQNPQPAPTGLRLEVSYGSAEQGRITHVILSWSIIPGFGGAYLVERSLLTDPGDARNYSVIATVVPAQQSNGRLRYEEDLDWQTMSRYVPTYRVRSTQNGALGAPSEERSAVLPPGVVTPPSPGASVPIAPAAGTGITASSTHARSGALVLGAFLLATGVGCLLLDRSVRNRRRRRSIMAQAEVEGVDRHGWPSRWKQWPVDAVASLRAHPDDRVLVIGQYMEQIEEIAASLGAPIITGKTAIHERQRLYESFRAGEIPVLVVSKVANFAIDLPSASVAIQVSGTFGSRQEEAQRLGRALSKDRR
jgi:hypothetical protein